MDEYGDIVPKAHAVNQALIVKDQDEGSPQRMQRALLDL